MKTDVLLVIGILLLSSLGVYFIICPLISSSPTWNFVRNPTTPLTCGGVPCLGHTEPSVLRVNNHLYLYYRTDHSIAVATNNSADGTSWTDMTTVLAPSSSGWDSMETIAPSIIAVNQTYYLFYEGNATSNGHRAIGVASSTNATGNFTKCACNPILTTSQPWEDGIVGTPAVTGIGNIFYMFYHGYNNTHDRIGVAYSHDLYTWTKEPSNPILDIDKQGTWDSDKVAPSSAYSSGLNVWVFYEGYNGTSWRIGVANGTINQTDQRITSLTRTPSPILDLGSPGAFDNATVQRPNVILSPDGTQFWMFYSGNDGKAFHLFRAVANESNGPDLLCIAILVGIAVPATATFLAFKRARKKQSQQRGRTEKVEPGA